MVNARLTVAVVIVVAMVLPLTLAIYGESATDGGGDARDVDSVQIEIKAVVSDGNKEEQTLDYSFDVATNNEFCYHNGRKIPFVTETVSTAGTSVIRSQTVEFMDVGVFIGFTPSIQDGKIVLQSKVIFSKLDSWSKDKQPIIKLCESEATTVHTDAKPMSVFSGDYLDKEKSITISIKAVHPRWGKK